MSACVLGPLGCAAAGLVLCLLGLLVLLLWWFVVCGLLVLVFNPPALR